MLPMATLDPWRILPEALAKYDDQFLKLKPVAGMITGDQAKSLFLQSGLPPQILAQIWNLADMNADGKMDRQEFAIAMHLIQLRLKGGELPKIMPPGLKLSAAPPSPQPAAMLPRQRSASVSSQDSLVTGVPPGGGLTEWAVPQPSKLKYTQVFNSHDRTRTGFLTGVQARAILLQSGLPQPVLAQIWNLSDIDTDGRLTCEEFVVAMYLIDSVKAGDPLPSTLPYDLVPPSMRRKQQRSTSIQSGMSSLYKPPPTAAVPPQPLADLLGGPLDPLAPVQPIAVAAVPVALSKEEEKLRNLATFEDKRRENFEKGQAELERRRLALLENQRKEQEERERKEREEQERREKIRLEQEKRRQQELERQLARQRELEQEREEQRRKALEQREAARKEMERQRQLEWERQRLVELQTQRQKEQEVVCHLKSRNKNLTFELTQVKTQVAELNSKVADTRKAVADMKSAIDSMRGERDTKISELNGLKLRIKELNNQMLALNQEKLNLDGSLKSNPANTSVAYNAVLNNFNAKQIAIHQLRNTLSNVEKELAQKKQDVENNNNLLKELQQELSTMTQDQENIYSMYEQRRQLVLNLKNKAAPLQQQQQPPAVVQDAWQDSWPAEEPAWGGSDWPTAGAAEETVEEQPKMVRYRALYQFDARNEDELSIMPGDIIMVPESQSSEPGWLGGELQGRKGWFPESYVEPADAPTTAVTDSIPAITTLETKRPLEGISEAPENGNTDSALATTTVRAIYPWPAKKEEHLALNKGDVIVVTEQQDASWWYGENTATNQAGWFLRSYTKVISNAEENGGKDSPVEGDYYVASFTYESEEPGDLTFQQGELIQVTQKDGDWWTGKYNGQSGIFPNTYVQPPLEEEQVEEPAVVPEATEEVEQMVRGASGKKPEIVTVIASYQASGQEQLTLEKGQLIQVRKKSQSGWWEGEMQVKGKKRQVGWFPASYVKPLGGGSNRSTPEPTRMADSPVPNDKLVAKYDFQGSQSDELSFKKGQIVTLINKEDASWWKGECEGAVGVFPSSYVKPHTPLVRCGALKRKKRKEERPNGSMSPGPER